MDVLKDESTKQVPANLNGDYQEYTMPETSEDGEQYLDSPDDIGPDDVAVAENSLIDSTTDQVMA
jgi:hypothetical protein